MKSKLLLISGSSLVGNVFSDYAKDNYDLNLTYLENKPSTPLPLTKFNILTDSISDLVTNINPDVVVHTIAHPSVDICEQNHEEADSLHVTSVQKLTDVCNENSIKLISFSTDAVFDGTSTRKYTENDTTNPLSYYGKTKLAAEKIILKNSKNVVLRTTVIYGTHTRSRFTNWVLDSLRSNKIVNAFTDQKNTPTLADDLSKSILKIIEQDAKGLFHATGNSCVSRYEIACKIAEKFNLNKKLIQQTSSDKINQIGPRPKNGCLDNSLLEKTIDFKFATIDEGIDFLFQRL